jgi:hypothetical protein
MALFSERYGYKKVSDVIIREKITPEIKNAICTCFDKLNNIFELAGYRFGQNVRIELEKHIWTFYFNQRLAYFKHTSAIITNYIEKSDTEWYSILDIIEFTIKYLFKIDSINHRTSAERFVNLLNSEFERLNFAYRIVGREIIEITSEQEIKAIEYAMDNSPRNIQIHLNSALEKYAQRPIGDYRNSIKESISAVEAFCREKTGENTLGKALNKLEKSGLAIHSSLKSAFEKLYVYTNHEETGIRHALMDDEANYTPTAEEALFMLISCSAFINYLNRKVK